MSEGVPKMRDTVAISPLLLVVAILAAVDFGLSAIAPAGTPPRPACPSGEFAKLGGSRYEVPLGESV